MVHLGVTGSQSTSNLSASSILKRVPVEYSIPALHIGDGTVAGGDTEVGQGGFGDVEHAEDMVLSWPESSLGLERSAGSL